MVSTFKYRQALINTLTYMNVDTAIEIGILVLLEYYSWSYYIIKIRKTL